MMVNKHLIGLFVLAALAACSGTGPQRVSRIEAPMPAAAPPPPPHVIARAESPLDDPNSLLSRRSVYFADDTNAVQVSTRQCCRRMAAIWPNIRISG